MAITLKLMSWIGDQIKVEDSRSFNNTYFFLSNVNVMSNRKKT